MGKHAGQYFRLEDRPTSGSLLREFQTAHPIELAFLNGNGDITRFPCLGAQNRPGPLMPVRSSSCVIQNRITHGCLEVTMIAIQSADSYFQVFVELLPVVRLIHHRDIRYVKAGWAWKRTVVAHRFAIVSRRKNFVSLKRNGPHLHFRAFVNVEYQLHRVGAAMRS